MSLLRVSALDAACELVQHLAKYRELSVDDAISQLRRGPSDVARLDYAGAMELLSVCDMELFPAANSSTDGRRQIVARLVEVERPAWRLAAGRGKKWCHDAMDPNTAQAIDWAALWNSDDGALSWWLELAVATRGLEESSRVAVGRIGERLTLEHERDRLKALGAPGEPVWRSIEDDTLGYDIESWDRTTSGAFVPLRIEVKAYSGTERRFFLSRGEWRAALRFHPQFVVDVWDVKTASLTRFDVDQVMSAIPKEAPPGEWQNLLIWPDLL
jgi:hypothetical protein